MATTAETAPEPERETEPSERTETVAPALGSTRRTLPDNWRIILAAVCAALAILHLYFPFATTVSSWTRALFGVSTTPSELMRNAIHFAGFAFLAAVLTPAISTPMVAKSVLIRWLDLLFGALVAVSAIYLAATESQYYADSAFSTTQWIAGAIVVFGALELTRRTSGLVIPILAVTALSYLLFWGPYAPAPFTFRGLSAQTVLVAAVYEDAGMFGTLASISATTVFLFILFGAFLVRSGAGDFVVAFARAIAGRVVGGPGLIAVIASGLTGTISGSAVANTASTGVVTIPLMKRAGFPRHFAGGVEAAASTGGQLMPPIMGAGAFVMASYTAIPYGTIVAAAALPALLYFASVAMFVRIEAKRQGLAPLPDDGVTLWSALRDGGASFILPIGAVIALLLVGYTPPFAAVAGIGAIIVSSWLTKTPMGVTAVWEALVAGARNMVMMGVLLCAVGLIVNAIVKAGVANTFSLMIVEWSQGQLLIAIALVALASLLLGMGLPVTAAYIVLAALSAPALAGMISDASVAQVLAAGALDPSVQAVLMLGAPEAAGGLGGPMPLDEAKALIAGLPFEIQALLRDQVLSPETALVALLSAHMIVFWLSQDSNVTPPVALAAFTAATIAGAPAMKTGLASWKIAKGLYIIPILFAYTPILSGDWAAALQISAFALVGIYGVAGALQGYMEGPLSWPMRAVSFAAGAAAMWPADLWINIAGAVVTIALFSWSLARATPRPSEALG